MTLSDVTTSPADYVFNPGSLDTGFNATAVSNSVFALAGQSDGKVIAAGFFAPVFRLNADGTTDGSFNVGGTGVNAIVTTLALQPDGKVILGGFFTFINQVSRGHIARLNTNGSLDTTFNPGTGADNTVWAVAVQPDGKVLLGGDFSSVDGVARNGLARVNADGSLDTSFDAALGLNQSVNAILVQPDGRILIGGHFSRVNGTTRSNVARLKTDGSLDTSFNPGAGANDVVLSVARQSTGKVVIGGRFTTVDGITRNRIARLNDDGTFDANFNPGTGADGEVQAVAVQPDDGVFIAGRFDTVNGTARTRVARLSADGAPDPTFNSVLTTGGNSGVAARSLFVQADGKLLVGGDSLSSGAGGSAFLNRLNGDLFATWQDGDGTDKTVTLPVVNDNLAEPPETLGLALSPLGGAAAGTFGTATLTISDTDLPPNITSASPPASVNLGDSYNHFFVATGVPDPSFSVSSGTLPPGLTLTSAGRLSGTPTTAGTFSGIVVKADNGVSPAATQTFGIKVNRPPVAINDSFQVAMNKTLTVAAPGVLGNDTDADGDHLSASVISGVSHGSLTLNADGSLTYTPATGFFGTDSFTYKSNDGVTDSGAAVVQITVTSPPGGLIEFSQSVFNADESLHFKTVTVTRTGDTSVPVTVDYATSDGTANERSDYTTALGTLRFGAGETSKSFDVLLTDDGLQEPDETINLALSNPTGGGVLGAQSASTILIAANDNPPPATNPVDDASFFVRQHYHDFLNREPDTPGLNFWVGQTTACGNPDLLVCRINVSAAFFLSIEFQETGFLVERMYKTAYGDANGTSTLGGAHQLSVPVVRFAEFLRDTQEIRSTPNQIVVGQGNWQQQLDENKNAFALDFVQRPRFTTEYPSTLTPSQFVDKLNANTGGVLTQDERDTLVNTLSSDNTTHGRSVILSVVAEKPVLRQRELNRAFVLMEYFGYLRRNPNDAPDSDYTGYDFWLRKLNDNGGDFIKAEMVKAFITADEYRHRFGQ